MSKTRLKLTIWFILTILAFGGVFFAIQQVARLVAYFQEGADPASALNIVPNVPPDLKVRLTWLPDDPDTGREMEPFTRTQIQSAYLRAWLQWNISYLRGEPYGLTTYFVGPALEAVNESVTSVAAQGWRVEQTDLSHELQLHLYSADGSIVSFTDHNARVVQLVRNETGQLVATAETTATFDVVMFLEDGNWRVRHWVRVDGDLVDVAGKTAVSPLPSFVQQEGTHLVVNGRSFQVRGINYYPQATPWNLFWPNYNSELIDQDLTRIQQLGLNTIRIFVPFDQFGGADVNPEMVARLTDLLDRAQAHDLKVIVTLFDFRTKYDLLLWPHTDRHLEGILPALAEHPAILAWDLKNEPDLDYDTADPVWVNEWLAHTARLARELDPNHLVTIGWSTPEAAQTLADVVDFVSFHYYREAEMLGEVYATLKTAVSDRPIILTEFGLSTWNSPFFPGGHTEAEQAAYYAQVLSFAETAEMGWLAWTLYDFEHVPGGVAGQLPWRSGPQRRYGLLRPDGSMKPAGEILLSATPATSPSWQARFKPFWITAVLVMGIFISIVWQAGRIYRQRQ